MSVVSAKASSGSFKVIVLICCLLVVTFRAVNRINNTVLYLISDTRFPRGEVFKYPVKYHLWEKNIK